MRPHSLPTLTKWKKSSRSNANTACVEVAHRLDLIAIRDSKLGAEATVPMLHVPTHEWAALVKSLAS